ncbi:uncharacterized protein LOC125807792 [Solanum verrucosum]|uniref:uncharacterized protein LOC125807792 n=1 Tax=Solanum verrucosum TaxID=315347 RepID=UPI0020D0F5DD|nr:uncharacterized protein LOC125807792 [Solanum verrucosum]
MQILQWLFKNANETNFNTNSSKKQVVTDEEVKSQGIVLFGISRKKRNRAGKSANSCCCNILNLFNTLRRKDIEKDYFYSTIRLKRLESSRRKQQFVDCMKMKKQSLTRGLSFRRKSDSATAKVLPVSDGHKEQNFNADKKEKANGDKIKTLSKMKELIRWAAAAAKSQKGGKYFGQKIFYVVTNENVPGPESVATLSKVLHLRDRSDLKAVPNDDQLSYDSPKISFRWDVDQNYSAISVTKNHQSIKNSPFNSTMVHIDQCPAATRKGNWVTTDSEFVVLELEL